MSDSVCILGSTGSIGCSALEVISNNFDKFKVTHLTANKNYSKLFQQCEAFRPDVAIMSCEESAKKLNKLVAEAGLDIEVRSGIEAVNSAGNDESIDIVIAAIVGAAGLLPTLTGVRKGHKILLANKEALVMSGELFMSEVNEYGATLLPVDSEHNAIFQSLPPANDNAKTTLEGVHKILLTGSGGPFLKMPIEEMKSKTPEEACAHPNWEMGKKISVDSATMMNKGLELIEACYMFDINIEQIDIVVHPQSIIHSMVSYLDGSVIAQMGNPDMKTPIAHCLSWPKRIDAGVKPLDFFAIEKLEFTQPDFERFPCLKLAIEAIKIGKSAPCVLNAANEVAVDSFLNELIRFDQISKVIEKTIKQSKFEDLTTLEKIITADSQARDVARSIVKEISA